MQRDIKDLVSRMTLEEKAGLCSGLDFWKTKSIERLGIPSIMLSDGPHGLRKQDGETDHLGMNPSIPATCFPSGAALACSWDRELIKNVGAALGEECQAENISIILGPAMNIKRSPLCGRNFEYLSEDPYLSSELAAHYIMGVQSQGVGTSPKHYAVNNQETKRMVIDTVVDERTLREIYLASFEGAVKKAQPWTVMCAYNKLNGAYCSENKYLLTDILKEEWGHEGFVVSDWGAVNERAEGLAAGLELEMPSSWGIGDNIIVDAVKSGELQESIVDKAAERILKVIFKAVDNKKANSVYSRDSHHKLARKTAGECIVLLKNEEYILPLKKNGSIAIIGGFAKKPRYQGGGSSHINPTSIDSALSEIEKIAPRNMKVTYADGYKLDNDGNLMFSAQAFKSISDIPDEALIKEAVEVAAKSDVAVIFAGLPESYESEGYDRKHMRIPEGHSKLIEAVAKVQKNTVVVLSNGSAIEMPFVNNVKGVLECYLGGQAFGGAVADVLFGNVNPSGKLAETFPVKLSDNPSYLNFPGDARNVEYREGIFVGYRYYDAKELPVKFPFGYGLSYTKFEYTGISTDKREAQDSESVNVSVSVKNSGKITGKEIVQLYVRDMESSILRPEKELKSFLKVELAPGEEKTVNFVLDKRAFAYYDCDIKDWRVEGGEFEILVGGSSQDIALKAVINIKSTSVIKKPITRNSTMGELSVDTVGKEIIKELFKDLQQSDNDGSAYGAVMEMMKDMTLRSLLFNSESAEKLDKILKKYKDNNV